MKSTLTTATFLDLLRQHPGQPLQFRADGDTLPPGFHLTEVKRVRYSTMDCGAATHEWSETQFELWVPRGAGRDAMPADKFVRIVDRVEKQLPLEGGTPARIFASFAGQPPALYDVTSVTSRDGVLWVDLAADRTRCKAAERRAESAGGGCCGSSAPDASTSSDAACGCGTGDRAEPAAACCA